MSIAELLDPFTDILRDHVSSAQVRDSERQPPLADLWSVIEETGFADALVPEARGGAGLTMAEVHPLVMACGEYLLPPAFGPTIVARALIATSGQDVPAGPILLWPTAPDGRMRSLVMPAACEATMALVQQGETIALQRLRATPDKEDGFGLMTADVEEGAALLEFDMPGLDLLDGAAALTASVMVGAMSSTLAMALSYANDRKQFGRPLGKFQAIQHQLSVAAEHVALAGVAARMPFVGNGIAFDPMRTAIAKLIANQAADIVCSVAHAVHGAIGISGEHVLQLYSRRLRRWQQSFGSETFWARRLGAARIVDRSVSTVDFLRAL